MKKVQSTFANEQNDGIRTPSTYLMQELGYDGIDVRGTELDNGDYGSVIFTTEKQKFTTKTLYRGGDNKPGLNYYTDDKNYAEKSYGGNIQQTEIDESKIIDLTGEGTAAFNSGYFIRLMREKGLDVKSIMTDEERGGVWKQIWNMDHAKLKTLLDEGGFEGIKWVEYGPPQGEVGAQQKANAYLLSGRDPESKKSERLHQSPEDSLTPDELEAFAAVGAEYLANGAKGLDAFTQKLTEEFPGAETFAEQIFKAAQGSFKATATTSRAKTPTELVNLMDADKALSSRAVYNMVIGYLREGMAKEDVIDAVTATLQEKFPGVTRDEVVVEFTNYGRIKYPNQEEIAKEARELRGIERLKAQLKDIMAGRAPKKTGQQRDPATLTIRGLMKDIKDAMKDMGIKHTYRKDQLKGSLDAIKTRYKNDIEELTAAVNKKEKIVRTKRTPEYDQEILDLKAQKEAAQKRYDDLFGIDRKELTDKQRISTAMRALDKQIALEEQMEREGILKRPKQVSKTPQTPELQARREKLAKMRAERRAHYEALHPKKTAEQRAVERLKVTAQKSIDRFEEILRTGKFPAKKDGTKYTADDELKALQKLRNDLGAAVDELRKDQRPRLPAEERARRQAVAQMEKTIKDLQRRIDTRDFTAKPKAPGLAANDPGVKMMKETIKNMREVLAAMEKEGTVPNSPEEKRILSQIKASEARKAKIDEKIRNKDFRPNPKPTPLFDRRLEKARFEEQQSKQKFLELRNKWKLDNYSLGGKAWYYGKSLLQLRKIIVLGLELGVIGRQGNIFTVSGLLWNPRRVARVLKSATRAFSQEAEVTIYNALMERPNAIWDKQAGMKLHGPFEEGYGNMEDLPDPELLNKLAELKVLGIPAKMILGVERFTRVFLNVARVEMFDAMLKQVRDGEPTLDEVKVIGNAVMNATGRGSFQNQRLDTGVALGNVLTISVRWAISRAKMTFLEPVWTGRGEYKGTLKARRVVLQELYIKTLISRALLTGLSTSALAFAKGGDDDEEEIVLEPTATDFGAIKYKGAKIDIAGGIRQYVNIISRMALGYKVDSKGKVTQLRGPKASPIQNTDTELWNFIRSRTNINLGLALDVVKGEFYGDVPVTPSETALRLISPIMVGDTIRLFQTYSPAEASAMWTAMFLGAGVTTPRPAKPATPSGGTLKLPKLKL